MRRMRCPLVAFVVGVPLPALAQGRLVTAGHWASVGDDGPATLFSVTGERTNTRGLSGGAEALFIFGRTTPRPYAPSGESYTIMALSGLVGAHALRNERVSRPVKVVSAWLGSAWCFGEGQRGMSFERNADRLIREAMADGRFDVVADGRPIDLDGYFSLPEDLRMAYSVLKSAGCVPEEVEYLKDVDRLRRALETLQHDAERSALERALADAELRLRTALERGKRP